MRWLFNDGGPLVILPELGQQAWRGTDPATPAGGRSDYDRAGELNDAGCISVGGSWGAVLPTGTKWAGWLTAEPATIYVAGIVAADEDDPALLLDLMARGDCRWQTILDVAEVSDTGLLLIHGASQSDEIEEYSTGEPGEVGIGDGIRARLRAGTYRIEKCRIENDWLEGWFLRLTRCERGHAGEPVAAPDAARR